MTVSIIGTRGCGKSTFIGLLHQSMEGYTNKDPEHFVFYITAQVGEKVLDIRNNLLQGEYPAATTRHQLEQLKFLMGFRPRTHEQVGRVVNYGTQIGKYGNYLGLVLSVYDVAGEDVQEYRRSKTANKIIKQVFDANIMVVIIDCSKFTNATKGRKFIDMLEYDKELAIILSAYVEYRNKNKMEDKLNPIFVMAKADSMDNEIRSEFNIDKLNKGYNREICEETGNKLMKSYLSASRAAVYGASRVGVPLEDARFFYSWVDEEKVDGVASVENMHRLKVHKPDGSHARNSYPEHMYEAFISHIRSLSYMYSDPKGQVEEIFGSVSAND